MNKIRSQIKKIVRKAPIISTQIDYLMFKIKRSRSKIKLNESEEKILEEVKRAGYCLVPNYLTVDECNKIIKEFERMIVDRPEFLRINSDIRIYGIESQSDLVKNYYADESIKRIGGKYLESSIVNAMTMINKVESLPGSKGSGEGWHKDSSFKQFKSLLYLNDVNSDSGPFEIIEGSHKVGNYLNNMLTGKLDFRDLRISDDKLRAIVSQNPSAVKTLTGDAGTLIIVDTAAIHRGRPPNGGVRYALTNYYVEPNQITDEYIKAFGPINPNEVQKRKKPRI